jgi:hypothetical protein
MDEEHAITDLHLHLLGQPALLDQWLGDPHAARVADGNEGRFHAAKVATL